MAEKNRHMCGADEQTPSLAQYFSWVNNTNEGSTEAHTLVNLEYFKWLRDTYGMQLDIYAWDAGNLDGPGRKYDHPDSPKLKAQYPNGYKPIVDAASEIGCKMGVWAGPDGYGNTPETAAERHELMVSLCRDYGFKLFKFDAVCGDLSLNNIPYFIQTMDECRKYVPDLIALNHRIRFGEAENRLTTFLWKGDHRGDETYVDVHRANHHSGSHHRVCNIERGVPENLTRLTEDHGVCLSSCLDYFEDDLIAQAFQRCFILAPEIYANPWLLRDDEHARLARIYNLHRKYRDILVNGAILPETYGKDAVTRGDGTTRLVVLNNPTWEKTYVDLSVSDEIGLDGADKQYVVKTLHPYESYVGTFSYGDTANITVQPFRMALILVQEEEKFLAEDYVLTNCEYETVYGPGAIPAEAFVFSGNGQKIESLGNIPTESDGILADNTIHAPVFLGKMDDCTLPKNSEQLYEASMFRADNDSLEAQSLKRSGPTKIPVVQAARDAFFNQKLYFDRAVESKWMFDGNPNTCYGGISERLNFGCLRVDLGKTVRAARVEIETNEEGYPYLMRAIPETAEYSTDLAVWNTAKLLSRDITLRHGPTRNAADRLTAVYEITGDIRYFRLAFAMNNIYSFRVFDEAGMEIPLESPHANDLMAHPSAKPFTTAKSVEITIPADAPEGSYIAAGIDGDHGYENVYCAAMCEGKPIGFDDRAVSYPFNFWEYIVSRRSSGYTYYLHVTPELRGKTVTVYALFVEPKENIDAAVWLCDSNYKEPVKKISL